MIKMLAAVSDVHAGSDYAPAPERIRTDDGGSKLRNPVQRWYHDRWLETWNEYYPRLLDRYKPDVQSLILNGDITEGKHHGSVEGMPLVGQHISIAIDLLREGPMQHGFDSVHMLRGTAAHVGEAAQHEEGIAVKFRDEGFPMVPDPVTGRVTSYWRKLDVDGIRVDCRHHGKMGRLPHTKDGYLRHYAHTIWEAHVRAGHEPPHLCIRSHTHTWGDSGKIVDMPTRVVSLPAWQGLTSFGHRIAIEDIGKCGMCVFIIDDGRLLEPEPILFQPDRPGAVPV